MSIAFHNWVAKLEKRIEELEKRVAELEKKRETLTLRKQNARPRPTD